MLTEASSVTRLTPTKLQSQAKAFNDGEVQSEVLIYLQSQAKDAEALGRTSLGRQRGPLVSDLSQAKVLTGDGEVQDVVLARLQSQAKEFKGDGVVQHEVLTNLRSETKEFNGDG